MTFAALLARLAAESSPEVADHLAAQLRGMLDQGRRNAAGSAQPGEGS